VAHETLDTFRPQLEATGFAVAMETPGSPLEVWGDRDAIGQILLNLLSNAEKYSLDRKEVRLVITAGKDHARIAVEDRGRGVPRGCEERF
jgi:protein-histidine pros-kinase